MWWSEHRTNARRLLARLAVVLAAASLTAGCFEPLYGRGPSPDADGVHDKLGAILIAPIPTRQGTDVARLAVGMHNALQYDFNGGAGATAPTHRLEVTLDARLITVIVDPVSGRPTAQIDGVTANYQLVEIATGKIVLRDTATAQVDTDSPGSQQRFAVLRAARDAEDRAVQTVAEAIRNRLASYLVAGT
jgi:LPS-assembly lipoprotein